MTFKSILFPFKYVTIVFIMMLFVAISSCSDPKPCTDNCSIKGEWIWMQSTGGENNETLQPDSLLSWLVIDDSFFRKYSEGTLILETGYEIQDNVNPVISKEDKILLLNNGMQYEMGVSTTELKLHEQNPNGYMHTYSRKEANSDTLLYYIITR